MPLTESQQNEVRTAFKLFDKDGSGTISKDELAGAFKKLGHDVDSREIEKLVADMDKDGSGLIEYHEFLTMMEKKMNSELTRADIKKAFDHFDQDGSGTISVEELDNVFKSLGRIHTPQELKNIVKKIDKDGSGLISLEEFAKIMV